jgi:hypothetical protein
MAAHELDLKTPLCVVRAPSIERVGVMFNPDTSPQSKFFVRSVEAAAPSLHMRRCLVRSGRAWATHTAEDYEQGSVGDAAMNTARSIVAGAALLALPAEAQDHRFETDPVATVRENFVACDVLSQLQRVMDNPRFLLAGECEPLPAGHRVRIYASRGPYVCIYPDDTITPCKWTHEKVLSK